MSTGASEMTLMAMEGIDFGDYSVRGLTMVVKPIPAQDGLMRTINGGLVDLTATQFRKRMIQISCDDVDAPFFGDVWQGHAVTVTCVPGVGEGINTDGVADQLVIDCLVDDWQVSRDEWGCVSSWQLSLLEV